jgi:hypothetical protein
MYLALKNLTGKWNIVQGWEDALNYLAVLWEARSPQHRG